MNFKKTCKSIASFVLGAGMVFSGLASNNLSKALFTEECRDALIRLNNRDYWKDFIESLYELPNVRQGLKRRLPENYEKYIECQLKKSTEDFAQCFTDDSPWKEEEFDYNRYKCFLLTYLSWTISDCINTSDPKLTINLLPIDYLPLKNLLSTITDWLDCQETDQIIHDYPMYFFTKESRDKLESHLRAAMPPELVSEEHLRLLYKLGTQRPNGYHILSSLRCCGMTLKHLLILSCADTKINPSMWALVIT
ncbi:MAG: hypothetical protein IJC57_03915, partial [Clostridia bacterium]|nr:hypothetical protein [Clostridia bacterium]